MRWAKLCGWIWCEILITSYLKNDSTYAINFFVIVVVDTNVFVSTIMGADGATRQNVRLCLQGRLRPLMGNALYTEYEDVCSRESLFSTKLISASERRELLDAFLASCAWIPIYYLWRPNLPDEADNHVLELAVAGGAEFIITSNKKDFLRAELNFPEITILNPAEFLSIRKEAR